MTDFRELRVAVIHDWLTGMRGGEKVLEAILELFPRSEIFTLFHFPGSVSPLIESRPIHVSRIQRLAGRSPDYRFLLPLFPFAVEGWSFDGFDLVISSSHCVAKGVDPEGLPHISYCHTPIRYVWDRFDDYFPPRKPLQRLVAWTAAGWLRQWDVKTSGFVDKFVANSHFVADRIARFYQRDADVVYPFVDDAFLDVPLPETRDDYHVMITALVPYKRVEMAIEASQLLGRKLVIIGSGPLKSSIAEVAGDTVELKGWLDRDSMIEVVGRARSLLFPGVEDFGITALEAMACGTPVVAYAEGGVLESVVAEETGLFFDRQDVESLAGCMLEVETRNWDRAQLRSRARQFSRSRFKEEFGTRVREVLRTA